jgi:glycosyltransferase involved in cell wall biosynthesis
VALEGFGLVVAESLAAGTPVLVTPVGGLPETVRDLSPDAVLGGSGPIVLGAGLADALLGRIPLPSPAACVRFARERFDWSAVGRQVSAVYAEAS